jgi:hypothetical protein
MTVDMLPEDVILEIFDFFVDNAWIEAWHTLVHVCRTWRNAVFGSPRRLNLRLYCTARTAVRETLNIWPPFPIIVCVSSYDSWGDENIFAALEHNDRICDLNVFDIPRSQFEKVLAAMRPPFSALSRLQLWSRYQTAPVYPDSFLGGSAPGLRELTLSCIPFPGLPKLLLSTTHLVHLELRCIPHSGYISPDTMVVCLSALTSLERLIIEFESSLSRPDRKGQRSPPPTRTLLPVLTKLQFKGVSEYSEDFVARIDAPLLDNLAISLFHRLIFDTPQLTQFISRMSKFKIHDEARVVFFNRAVSVTLPQTFDRVLKLGITYKKPGWELSSLAQVCSSSALIPAVEHLYILDDGTWDGIWEWQHRIDNIENSQWLELFHPFTAVKDLYISSEFTRCIAPALQELVGESVTEVLPALQTLFLEEPHPSGSVQKTIGQFVAARQLSGHSIAVCRWEREIEYW